jgi:hypothetical protein
MLLGYDADIERGSEREMYILNSDLDGFSGYGVIKIKDGVEEAIAFHRN